jgi:hypothetical protein
MFLLNKKIFVYFSIALLATVSFAYLTFMKNEEVVIEQAGASSKKIKIKEQKFDVPNSTNADLKTKPSPLKFIPPNPSDTEWKLNYDDEDEPDKTERDPLIASIEIPGLTASASPTSSPFYQASPVKENESERTELFNPADLKELENFGADVSNNGLIPGKHVSLKESLDDLNKPSATPSVSPSPKPPWYVGQARGYAMLYLMHPKARDTVLREVEIMEKARIKSAFLSVLADGTFGFDYPFLEQIVRRINNSGMTLKLGIYFSNGPEMRTPIAGDDQEGTVNDFTPEEFREEIKTNQDLKNKFINLFNLAKPIYALNQSLSADNENLAYVMLEDNLDRESYIALRKIAGSVLEGQVRFIRNPCPGCYEDNDIDPDQDNLEFHDPEDLHALRVGDGYSMDGKGLFFPNEIDPNGLSVEDTKIIISASMQQNISYFALWRASRQGIIGTSRGIPENRIYEVPTLEQEQYEIQLLRHGLTEQVANEEEDDDLTNTVDIE